MSLIVIPRDELVPRVTIAEWSTHLLMYFCPPYTFTVFYKVGGNLRGCLLDNSKDRLSRKTYIGCSFY